MHKLFKNILVPVTLDGKSDAAINKAIRLSLQLGCDVHLLHVKRKPLFSWDSNKKTLQIKSQLQRLKDQYAGAMAKGSQLHVGRSEGRLENALAEYALVYNIDLILTEKRKTFFSAGSVDLNVNRLSARTSCPVLSLQPGSLDNIKNIVLPVSSTLPLRKIMLATYLAKNFNAAIHLISLTRFNSAAEARSHVYLEKAYQLLRENTNLSLNCRMVVGENIAGSTLEYARRVEADLILVNTGQESLLPGPASRWFAKFLPEQSSIPVITVA